MLLDEITTYLAGKGHGTFGTDLFAGELPDKPDDLVTVIDTPGLTPTLEHSTPGVAVKNPGFQIFVRNVSPQTSRSKAAAIYADLSTVNNALLSGVRYLRITPVQEPFPIGRDENNRYQQVCNYQVSKDS